MCSAVPTGAVLRLTKTGLDPSSAATVETADSSGERSTDPSGPLSVFTHRKTTSTLDNASASTSNDSRPVASDRSRSVPRPDVASPDDPDAHANASSVCYTFTLRRYARHHLRRTG